MSFHCSAGKDRTGVLAAILLSVLGVSEADIATDYCLSESYSIALKNQAGEQRWREENQLPVYMWDVLPESVFMMLTSVTEKFGSTANYLLEHEPSYRW